MAWCWIGGKPLFEPMLTWFTDIYAALGGDEFINLLRPNEIVTILQTFSNGSGHQVVAVLLPGFAINW